MLSASAVAATTLVTQPAFAADKTNASSKKQMYADLVWQSETDGSESAHLWGAAAGPSGKALLFTWKDVSEIKVADFKHAILRYAKRCKEHKLTFAFIDIRMLSAKIDFDFS